ncbi:transporter substrate-binding domain-containing protein, partial [Klebsiella pneumoniae]|uniref:transporter substrate-binding domain-containing protein n=1 Tax=Klebsiella pneumoniae TaxID=573 RepID=UPI003969A3E4
THDAMTPQTAGQLPGVMGDFATLDAWQQENPDYAIMDERATDPAYYGKQYAIAVRKDDPELLNAINDALAAVMATPDFQQMQQKWFK